ncbi:MAG TPA: two-component system response regulator [Elusimicrobia bacterium]|nr:two-component system response regulator [Elusimicrobiota bacterium]
MEKEKSKISVLIVDDSEIIRLFLEQLLISEGCDVTAVGSGEEALEYFKKRAFDAAFIDIRLPGMNGLETYKEMLKINPKIKAMMMTAYADNEIIGEAIKLGVSCCLKKPFGIDEVLAALDKLKK